jgi:hypothetical protein
MDYTEDRRNKQVLTLPDPFDVATNRLHQLAIVSGGKSDKLNFSFSVSQGVIAL